MIGAAGMVNIGAEADLNTPEGAEGLRVGALARWRDAIVARDAG